MRASSAEKIDAIVTDPPYGLSREPDIAEVLTHWLNGDDYQHRGGGFMGKSWDSFVPGPSVWREAYRVLKPGGYMLAFAGTRTADLMGIAIRLAGFEIRDELIWLYGEGFPKSYNVSKGIDKVLGVEREVVGRRTGAQAESTGRYGAWGNDGGDGRSEFDVTVAGSEEARQWEGWGTALKPAHEPIILARKPLAERTITRNVLEHGTGALNIDATRINPGLPVPGGGNGQASHGGRYGGETSGERPLVEPHTDGRWPANVILDEEAAAMVDEQTGDRPGFSGGGTRGAGFRTEYVGGEDKGWTKNNPTYFNDSGGASRFFYVAKAQRAEREAGLGGFETRLFGQSDGAQAALARGEGTYQEGERASTGMNTVKKVKNDHPTVKPVALMRYLVRLVTPPGGLVLDPFAGSGTTGIACILEGFDFVGMEMDEEYAAIARARMEYWAEHGEDTLRVWKEEQKRAAVASD